jgi:23S rRNA (cytosine1962-C5)-methyltransferase
VINRHPWVFSGAIQQVTGEPEPGDLVSVVDEQGQWLATAYYNPQSQIRARIVSWDEATTIDDAFWERLLARAVSARDMLELPPETTAYRLVNAEADGLPGLIVDRYGEYLVVQCATLGIDSRKELLFDLLQTALQPEGIIERSDLDVRKKEGLAEAIGVRRGKQPAAGFTVLENGYLMAADLLSGHKTGLYLDQRDNRRLVGQRRFLDGKRVLNLFAYTGGFAVYAAAAGASAITNVDSSAALLGEARQNMALNGHAGRAGDEYVSADAFELLRRYRDQGRAFDAIIVDPPKFAHSKGDVERACRGYKDLNWLAMRLLTPGGLLATFSCSGLVDANLFQKVIFAAAVDAARDAQILYRLGQAPDHPTLLTFPESAYLKGFLCRVW